MEYSKKQVENFARILGAETHYQGKSKTMFINDKRKVDVEDKIVKTFGYNLHFKLATK